MQYEHIRELRALVVEIESYFDGQLSKNKIWVGTIEGLPVYFIEPDHPNKFFWRGTFYGEHDDFKRFSYFSRAALGFLLRAGKKPDKLTLFIAMIGKRLLLLLYIGMFMPIRDSIQPEYVLHATILSIKVLHLLQNWHHVV
ncbi:hypothetical protein K1719_001699 [Acacia pycnantha]|nr:hypothetical protein K1719_001699 [Acacia pycnantha]